MDLPWRLVCALLVLKSVVYGATSAPTMKPTCMPSMMPTVVPTSFNTAFYNIYAAAGTGAGSTVTGTGGPATAANFYAPMAVFEDTMSGILYVSDYQGCCIRYFSPHGDTIVYNYAGICNNNGDGASGVAATSSKLDGPLGMYRDAVGNNYVADRNNCKVRQITTTGIVSVFAGTGGSVGVTGIMQATAGQIGSASDLYINPAGTLYVVSYSLDQVFAVSTDNMISVYAGLT